MKRIILWCLSLCFLGCCCAQEVDPICSKTDANLLIDYIIGKVAEEVISEHTARKQEDGTLVASEEEIKAYQNIFRPLFEHNKIERPIPYVSSLYSLNEYSTTNATFRELNSRKNKIKDSVLFQEFWKIVFDESNMGNRSKESLKKVKSAIQEEIHSYIRIKNEEELKQERKKEMMEAEKKALEESVDSLRKSLEVEKGKNQDLVEKITKITEKKGWLIVDWKACVGLGLGWVVVLGFVVYKGRNFVKETKGKSDTADNLNHTDSNAETKEVANEGVHAAEDVKTPIQEGNHIISDNRKNNSDDEKCKNDKDNTDLKDQPKMIASSVWYFATPDEYGSFAEANRYDAPQPKITAYRLVVPPDRPEEGQFWFDADEDSTRMSVNAPEREIEVVCEAENALSEFRSRIHTCSPGQVTKREGKWVVEKKAIIRYE